VGWIHLNKRTVQRRALVKKTIQFQIAQKRVAHAYRLIECSTRSDYCKHASVVVVVVVI